MDLYEKEAQLALLNLGLKKKDFISIFCHLSLVQKEYFTSVFLVILNTGKGR